MLKTIFKFIVLFIVLPFPLWILLILKNIKENGGKIMLIEIIAFIAGIFFGIGLYAILLQGKIADYEAEILYLSQYIKDLEQKLNEKGVN